jgi:hypothetical protein
MDRIGRAVAWYAVCLWKRHALCLNPRAVMIDLRRQLELSSGTPKTYHSLPRLEAEGVAKVSRLPVSIRILLESVLRNIDGQRIRPPTSCASARHGC